MVTRVEKVAAVVVLVVALDAYEYEYSSSEVRDECDPRMKTLRRRGSGFGRFCALKRVT